MNIAKVPPLVSWGRMNQLSDSYIYEYLYILLLLTRTTNRDQQPIAVQIKEKVMVTTTPKLASFQAFLVPGFDCLQCWGRPGKMSLCAINHINANFPMLIEMGFGTCLATQVSTPTEYLLTKHAVIAKTGVTAQGLFKLSCFWMNMYS